MSVKHVFCQIDSYLLCYFFVLVAIRNTEFQYGNYNSKFKKDKARCMQGIKNRKNQEYDENKENHIGRPSKKQQCLVCSC